MDSTKKARSGAPRARGVITPGELYTVAELRRRLGVGDFLWRKLRNRLRIRHIGAKRFVLADDVLSYLDSPACDSAEGVDQ